MRSAPVRNPAPDISRARDETYLERQPSLDLVGQDLGDASIKVGEDLDRQLRLDAPFGDEIVESVRQGHAETGEVSNGHALVETVLCTCSDGRAHNMPGCSSCLLMMIERGRPSHWVSRYRKWASDSQ